MSRDVKSNSTEQVPFMEEWKARRERMRLRSSSSLTGSRSIDSQAQQEVELQTQTQSSHRGQACGKDLASKKVQSQAALDVEAHDPVTSKTKEKKGSPQKKHRTQIEKRKLREKRRPTGIVNLIQTADTDVNEDINANNENIDQDTLIQNQELWISEGTCLNRNSEANLKTFTSENRDEILNARQSWMEELQKAVREKRQDNHKLTTQLNDKEGSVLLLQRDVKALTQKMLRAKDENKRLKEENQMLLKMMGHLSS
ncbi:PRKC apoptosis WT1 regulator protein-like [Hyla sarda]|uniref:PRKC apoptosis WT1 regulator protein-like n=1 Tax=Hyla sarda TaxID=327740 RepID=UPI0024C40561|nr:PRKC apoptosis WT1 regulator protein-like [Hyla sarda]XP_056382717.1 PRKC apoptosis WT1 regulator protein-like [Hyla sarda]XP_056382718.1 PRKC apoptosis WT1 regulator protein-like [Hyla sarda]XP_056382719.1 PRKC apoptosis WT1 regulator protein-like [Hyla sarda]